MVRLRGVVNLKALRAAGGAFQPVRVSPGLNETELLQAATDVAAEDVIARRGVLGSHGCGVRGFRRHFDADGCTGASWLRIASMRSVNSRQSLSAAAFSLSACSQRSRKRRM